MKTFSFTTRNTTRVVRAAAEDLLYRISLEVLNSGQVVYEDRILISWSVLWSLHMLGRRSSRPRYRRGELVPPGNVWSLVREGTSARQSQKTVTAYLKSKQLLSFGFAWCTCRSHEQITLSSQINLLATWSRYEHGHLIHITFKLLWI